MKVLVESMLGFSEKAKSHAWAMMEAILGSLFFATLSQFSIPFYPVPMSLQTLGIFLLAIGQGGKKAFYSILLYLGFITLGFPFLAGGNSHMMWFTLPRAGYLIGFPIAAYVIGKMVHAKKNPPFLWMMGSMLLGQMIIYTLGVIGLTFTLSFKESFLVGCVPFLPIDGVKLIIASGLGSLWIRFKKS